MVYGKLFSSGWGGIYMQRERKPCGKKMLKIGDSS